MAYDYQFYYSETILFPGPSWVELSNAVNFTINVGRREQLDQYSTATASVTLRYPTGYASPISALKTGTFFKIDNINSGFTEFTGVISNVSVNYGIPYVSNVGNADYITIDCESWFASLSRMSGNNYAMATGLLASQLSSAQTQTGVSLVGTGWANTLDGTTISNTWGDWLNQTALTINGRLIDAAINQEIVVVSPYSLVQSSVSFTDGPDGVLTQTYNQISFTSLADNFYTQVTVVPESFGSATVTQAGATVPYRTYTVNTFNASTSQATDYANYLLGNYGTSQLSIASISCSEKGQPDAFVLDQVGTSFGSSGIWACVGAQTSVTFRGTTYACIVEGCTVTGTPEDTIYTFYLSGADLNDYLILNNAVFGKLDSNRLGY